MKYSKLILSIVSIFLLTSCSKEEIWYSGTKEKPTNTVTFSGNIIYTKIAVENPEEGEPAYLETEYDKVEKIVSDEDAKASLYVLQEVSNGKFSVLPEYSVDDKQRRFDIQTSQIQSDTKDELMKNLNKEIDTFKDGPTKLPMKYAFFGNVKINGEKFTKK